MKKLFLLVLVVFSNSLMAGVITTIGSGSAVTNVDRLATFTGISGSLISYAEDDLLFTVPVTNNSNPNQCCFSNVHYDFGGNSGFVTITSTDSALFSAIEFDVGSGFGPGIHNVVWETLKNGTATGSGIIGGVTNYLYGESKVILGWQDSDLFDTLRVGAGKSYNAFGQFQAIALDNVKVQVQDVPAPSSMMLFLLGLTGFALSRKSRQSRG